MDASPDTPQNLIARLIKGVPAEADARAGALADALRRADRRHPAGVRWLKRWKPLQTPVQLATCSCSAGRCAVCN